MENRKWKQQIMTETDLTIFFNKWKGNIVENKTNLTKCANIVHQKAINSKCLIIEKEI